MVCSLIQKCDDYSKEKKNYFRPVSFSLMASFMSAITLIGVSNENYQFGTQFVVINISYGLATPLCAYLFLPVFYNMRVTSAYEVTTNFFILRHINKV